MKFLVILISLFCISTVSSVSYTFEIHISPGIQVWKTEEVSVVSNFIKLYVAKGYLV